MRGRYAQYTLSLWQNGPVSIVFSFEENPNCHKSVCPQSLCPCSMEGGRKKRKEEKKEAISLLQMSPVLESPSFALDPYFGRSFCIEK